MIGELLDIIAKELGSYIDAQMQMPTGKKSVLLHKPTNLKGESEIPDNTLSLSLLNIEEETSTRDAMVKKQVINGEVYQQNPAVNVNLQIIFIANFPNDYKNELNYVGKVLEFFQQKPAFTPADTNGLNELGLSKIVFKLNTLELEEQHNVWSLVGTKYMPSIVYKVGLITIQDELKPARTKVVKTVDINTKQK